MKPLMEILEQHKLWLESDGEGGERAALTRADLTDANLTDADLTRADLRGANLTRADLRGANLTDANLTSANLTSANLTSANLRGANLTRADLRGANLDFGALPLWCGGLDVHIDGRLTKQLLYHLVRNVLYSKNTSDEVKAILSAPEIVALANEFHRAGECGKIKEGQA